MTDLDVLRNAPGALPVPAFDEAEYASRLRLVRTAMAEERLDGLLIQSTTNVAWLYGFEHPRGNTDLAVLVTDDQATVVLRLDDLALLPEHAGITEVRAVASPERLEFDDVVAGLVRSASLRRLGLEFGRYPVRASTSEGVRSQTSAEIVDATSLVMDLRLVKSEAEIAMMRQAATYTNAGMRAAVSQLGVGKTDNDIGGAAYSELLRNGSEAPYPAPFIMVGERTGWGPHLSWKRFRQQHGDIVNIELTGVHHRYAAPQYRTASIGEPTKELEAVSNAVIDCVNVVLETARPGESAHDIAARAASRLDPIRDIVYCTGQVGYGVGLTLSPNWVEHSFRIIQGNHRPVLPGMAFHSPTAVRLPGRFAVSFSETWVMTSDGPEILTSYPRELLIAQ